MSIERSVRRHDRPDGGHRRRPPAGSTGSRLDGRRYAGHRARRARRRAVVPLLRPGHRSSATWRRSTTERAIGSRPTSPPPSAARRRPRQRLAARTAELEAGLGAVVLAARAELDRIEREQDEAVAAIRAEAEAEATRIREAARLEVQVVREASASLSALARPQPRLPIWWSRTAPSTIARPSGHPRHRVGPMPVESVRPTLRSVAPVAAPRSRRSGPGQAPGVMIEPGAPGHRMTRWSSWPAGPAPPSRRRPGRKRSSVPTAASTFVPSEAERDHAHRRPHRRGRRSSTAAGRRGRPGPERRGRARRAGARRRSSAGRRRTRRPRPIAFDRRSPRPLFHRSLLPSPRPRRRRCSPSRRWLLP